MSSYYRSILNVQAVAPPAFLPTDITGCQLWLDAADATTIAIGTGVSQWDDKSGNARHAIQAVGASQPAYNLAAVNGLNVVNFDGGDHFRNDTMPLLTAKTAYVVLKANNATGGGVFQFRGNPQGNAQTLFRELFLSATHFIGGDFSATNQTLASAPLTSREILHLSKWTQNGSTRNISYALNGTNLSVNGNPPFLEVNTNLGYKIGCISNTTEFYNGLMCEIVLYNRDDISGADDLLIRNYLSNKWAI